MGKGIIGSGRSAVSAAILLCAAIFLVSFLLENLSRPGSLTRAIGAMMHLLTIFVLLFVCFRLMKEPGLLDIEEAIKDEVSRIQRMQNYAASTIIVRLPYRRLSPLSKTVYIIFTVIGMVSIIIGIADVFNLIPRHILMSGPHNITRLMPHWVSGAIFFVGGIVLFFAKMSLREKTFRTGKTTNTLQ